jgi:hypothetical protein
VRFLASKEQQITEPSAKKPKEKELRGIGKPPKPNDGGPRSNPITEQGK